MVRKMPKKSSAERQRTYSCTKCGSVFEAYPPDDRHIIATRSEKDYEDNLKVDYKCREKDCGAINTIYWGAPGAGFVVTG
jgi:rubredoxin